MFEKSYPYHLFKPPTKVSPNTPQDFEGWLQKRHRCGPDSVIALSVLDSSPWFLSPMIPDLEYFPPGCLFLHS